MHQKWFKVPIIIKLYSKKYVNSIKLIDHHHPIFFFSMLLYLFKWHVAKDVVKNNFNFIILAHCFCVILYDIIAVSYNFFISICAIKFIDKKEKKRIPVFDILCQHMMSHFLVAEFWCGLSYIYWVLKTQANSNSIIV